MHWTGGGGCSHSRLRGWGGGHRVAAGAVAGAGVGHGTGAGRRVAADGPTSALQFHLFFSSASWRGRSCSAGRVRRQTCWAAASRAFSRLVQPAADVCDTRPSSPSPTPASAPASAPVLTQSPTQSPSSFPITSPFPSPFPSRSPFPVPSPSPSPAPTLSPVHKFL